MIRYFLISIISSIFLIGLVGVVTFKLSQNVYAIQPGQPSDCRETAFLWKHTYGHPGGQPNPITWSRFIVQTPDCVIAKGTIENDPSVSNEKDGDYHFLLTPDNNKEYKDLLNKYNTKGLMVEIICWDKKGIDPSYTKEYGDYCNGVNVNFPTLKYGDHVAVTGKWVQDVGHPEYPAAGAHVPWNEIHPAAKVEKIS